MSREIIDCLNELLECECVFRPILIAGSGRS